MFTMSRQPTRIIFPEEHRLNLNAIMRQVYIWMGLGTLLTAAVAFATVNSPFMQPLLHPIVMIVGVVVELGMVWGLRSSIHRLPVGVALVMFFVYAALNGFTLSLFFVMFSTGSIVTAFLATALLFGVMALFAFTTSMDLSKLGTPMTMSVVGLIIAMVVNMFVDSSLFNMLISMVGVLIFAALTAYDTRTIGHMVRAMDIKSDHTVRFGLLGALRLYFDFINLFLSLLRLMTGSHRH